MKMRKIGWAKGHYDMEFDDGDVMVDELMGNWGLGGIVAVLFGIGYILPVSLTIRQMATGQATGNPLGAIIAATLLMSWPLLWGIRQFFLRRSFYLKDGVMHFNFRGLFRRQRANVAITEYERLVYGQTDTQSSADGHIGSTARFFVEAKHPNKKYNIRFYENVAEQMRGERIMRHGELLCLTPVDITPEKTARAQAFQEKAQAFLAARQTDRGR